MENGNWDHKAQNKYHPKTLNPELERSCKVNRPLTNGPDDVIFSGEALGRRIVLFPKYSKARTRKSRILPAYTNFCLGGAESK